MANLEFFDRVVETTTTAGTGAYALAGVAGNTRSQGVQVAQVFPAPLSHLDLADGQFLDHGIPLLFCRDLLLRLFQSPFRIRQTSALDEFRYPELIVGQLLFALVPEPVGEDAPGIRCQGRVPDVLHHAARSTML